ncbi:hypothetical protein JCM8208_006605, partial [Rhodotorula glutinis]
MAAQPSTPSISKGANAFGKLLNKLRTPTSADHNNAPAEGERTTPRSASPFSAMMGRRSSSKASLRSYSSNTSAAAPPFPPSLNGSSASLASNSATNSPPLAFDTDDDDLDLPQFESERMSYRPRGSGGDGFYAHHLASSSTLASTASAPGDGDYTALPAPPRPSTSMSTRGRGDSVSGSGGAWKGAPASTAGAREAVGSLSRGFGRGTAGRALDASVAQGEDDELTHKVSRKPDELVPPTRAPLSRLPSNDATLSASQPSSHSHLASTTPGLPRAGLSKSSTSTLPSAGTRRLFASRPGGGERIVGRARRVVQPVQPAAATPEGPVASEAYDGDQSRSVKEDSPDASTSTSTDTSPDMAPPPRPRPPISPNSHGRSLSELPPSSPKIASAERAASTVTIGASSYLAKHSVSSSNLRPSSSLSNYSASDSNKDVSPPGTGNSYLSASASARGAKLQPSAQGSTAFRNRFLSSGSGLSINASSSSLSSSQQQHYSPPSDAASASSQPSPPMLAQSLSSSTSAGNGGASFRLAPMGGGTGGLSRKNSVSMLSSLAEDGQPAVRAASLDIRREAVAARVAGQFNEPVAAGRASLDERRASPPRERDMMIPYAHRRGTSISQDANQETAGSNSSSSTHGGTTLVNGSGGGLKRSNSVTITQGSLMQPAAPVQQVARPASSMAMYRDESQGQQQQQRPQVVRVPSGQQQAQYQHLPPPVMDVLPDQPPAPATSAFQPYHDENAYDARSYARPGAPPTSTARPALTEVNRPYAPPVGVAPSTQPRQGAPQYGSASQQSSSQKDYHVPLRDRSPGMAEATPSVTVQQQHYQGHQVYQQQQYLQQQQQQQPHLAMQMQQQQLGYTPGGEPQQEKRQPKPIIVNGKAYHRAGVLGRGGSSKVYRVMSASNELFALKRVDTRNDAESRASFINEITLLRKLIGKPEIIQLVDSEIQGKYVIM